MFKKHGEVDGMRSGRRIQITQRKPPAMIVCPV
jgi:hypothetical protein